MVTGFTNAFASPSPNFTAATLLDPTTIRGGAGGRLGLRERRRHSPPSIPPRSIWTPAQQQHRRAAPDPGRGANHRSGRAIVGSADHAECDQFDYGIRIGHASTSTIENFNTYAAFVTQLQSELNGTTLVTGITAVGQYTAATFSFSATSITIFLNN